jgi:site-specific recombinase XerD
MPENTRRAHIIGFPGDHSHFIQGYVYACEAEGKTPATVTSYRENLSRFQKAVSELSLPRQPSLLTREHIRHYMAHLRASGSSASTVNDRLAVLRLWLRWLREEGVIESDPTEGVKKLREERKVMETITPTQVEDHLLRLCSQLGRESAPAKRKAERDRAIILLLYNTGLRASELVGLDFADVDFDRMVVLVRHGKGRKQRVVSLGRVAR